MRNALLIALAGTIGLIGVLLIVGNDWPPPENPPRQGEALDAEAFRIGIVVHSPHALSRGIREPQNTWSSLAFVAVGGFLISCALTRRGRLVGAALVAVGIGSFLYHASASRTLRHADVAAMYGLFLATTVLSVGSWRRFLGEQFDRSMGVIAPAILILAVGAAASRNFVILGTKPLSLTMVTAAASTVLIASLAATAFRRRCARTLAQVVAIVGIFALAVIFQLGDRPGAWLCAPESIVQAHALWHLFSAMAIFLAVGILERDRKDSAGRNPAG